MGNRIAKLIFCSEDNHNKYYNMVDNGSTISVEYGRVGSSCQTMSYPSSKWSSLLSSKVKKGYKEVTHLFTEAVSSSTVSFLDIADSFVAGLIRKLEGYTKQQVSNNYNVTADSVTEKQIREAQSILNYISQVKSNTELNKYLLEVFAIIPRKMRKVQDHLYSEAEAFRYSVVEEILSKEQDILDAMAQQVKQVELVNENTSDKLTLLDAMGLEIFNTKADQEEMIKKKLGMISDKYVRSFRIENKNTQKKFNNYLDKKQNKKTELLWHGSRSENILPIMQTGLLLRPTNAVITGKMFGIGTYFSSKAIKSYGYTSGRNSLWARGNSSEAFMFLNTVHVGTPLIVERWESWMSHLDESKLKAKGDYDSVHAKAGFDLKNDETMSYNEAGNTMSYLVELKG
jgi:poly [ADP-ribose] polymerase